MRSQCRRGSGVNSGDEQNTSAAFTRALSLSLIADMNSKKPDLEARAEALLKRIHRHNQGLDSLTASKVRSSLQEIRAIGKMNLVPIVMSGDSTAEWRSTDLLSTAPLEKRVILVHLRLFGILQIG